MTPEPFEADTPETPRQAAKRRERDVQRLEKHIATVAISLIVLLLGWVGVSINKTTEAVAVLNTQVSSLSSNLDRAVTKNDVVERIVIEDRQRITDLDRRVSILERRDKAGVE